MSDPKNNAFKTVYGLRITDTPRVENPVTYSLFLKLLTIVNFTDTGRCLYMAESHHMLPEGNITRALASKKEFL